MLTDHVTSLLGCGIGVERYNLYLQVWINIILVSTHSVMLQTENGKRPAMLCTAPEAKTAGMHLSSTQHCLRSWRPCTR